MPPLNNLWGTINACTPTANTKAPTKICRMAFTVLKYFGLLNIISPILSLLPSSDHKQKAATLRVNHNVTAF